MKIAGISSKKLGDSYEGTLKNNYLYNGKELFDEADLNWYDYGFRNYDPQIGRFTQLDPLTDDYPFYTPYQFAGCEPIRNVDLDGLEPLDAVVTAASNLSEVIVKTAPKVAQQVVKSGGFWRGVGRFFKGAAEGLIETAKFAVNILNPDLSKNSLVQTGKFVVNTVKDPVGTYNSIKTALQNTDWRDPATYGKIFSAIVTPVAAVKAVKYFSTVVVNGGRAAVVVEGIEAGVTTEALVVKATEKISNSGLIVKGSNAFKGGSSSSGRVVIGETMSRVEAAGWKYNASIINVPDHLNLSGMMQYNRKWMLQQLRESKTILDIGLDPNKPFRSMFHQMEQNMIRNYKLLHPDASFKYIPIK